MGRVRAAVRLFERATNKLVSTELYDGDDIGQIAGAVNYRLRVEVTPYWPIHTLRMETEVQAPSGYTESAMRNVLFGLAVAWRMVPGVDPEGDAHDKPTTDYRD